MFYDNHEMVRVQVTGEEWHDQSPQGPASAPGEEEGEEDQQKVSPYKIIGSMQSEGLGCCIWWESADQEEGEGA